MGWIGKLLSFTRTTKNGINITDAKVNPGGGANKTVQHFSDSGDDSHPLDTDFNTCVEVQGTGRASSVGWIDPINEQKALKGEKRIYARKADGSVIGEIWLHNDGKIRAENGFGYIELRADGTVDINGVIIDPAGATIIPDSLILDNKEIAGHSHPQAVDGAGDTQENVGPNI